MKPQIVRDVTPTDVAKYFLARSAEDGEPVTPLKMQKLVYYAYVWTLVKNKKKLFTEPIEAWANGPVVRSLYGELKQFGFSPIEPKFTSSTEVNKIVEKLPKDVAETLSEVYEKYMTKTAFELVVLTHSEAPWKLARKGLSDTEAGSNSISDESIFAAYGSQEAR